MVDYVIETNQLSKIYSKNKVVNSVNMHVEKGKIYGLLGKNGAGKTTTMCMLLNLTYPSSGEIFLFGKNPKKHSNVYSSIGSIIETPGFYENLTAYENLKIIAKIRGDFDPYNINSVLHMVNLDKDKSKKFKDFSLGMKQRLGIAAAVMERPDIVILDEPTNALDSDGVEVVKEILREEKKRGALVIISCHDFETLKSLSDRMYLIEAGRLKEYSEAAACRSGAASSEGGDTGEV
jgi:ABC-2 type transport system ATP-binding protein/bacitracin transport system ATP-binding protein